MQAESSFVSEFFKDTIRRNQYWFNYALQIIISWFPYQTSGVYPPVRPGKKNTQKKTNRVDFQAWSMVVYWRMQP